MCIFAFEQNKMRKNSCDSVYARDLKKTHVHIIYLFIVFSSVFKLKSNELKTAEANDCKALMRSKTVRAESNVD
jgi:hypothetical protein